MNKKRHKNLVGSGQNDQVESTDTAYENALNAILDELEQDEKDKESDTAKEEVQKEVLAEQNDKADTHKEETSEVKKKDETPAEDIKEEKASVENVKEDKVPEEGAKEEKIPEDATVVVDLFAELSKKESKEEGSKEEPSKEGSKEETSKEEPSKEEPSKEEPSKEDPKEEDSKEENAKKDLIEETTPINLSVTEAEDLEPELEEDEAEEYEDELSEEELAQKKSKKKKIILIVVLSILGVLAAVYLGFAYFFHSHFRMNTTINGVDSSMMSVEQVEEYFADQVDGYVLTLQKSDGSEETIEGAAISLQYKKSDELNKLLKKDNPFLWIEGLWENTDLTAKVGVEFDDSLLTTAIDNLALMAEENQIAPISAIPEYDGTEFVVKEEDPGSQIDTAVFNEKVREYINGFRPELILTEEECYIKPVFTKDSPEVLAACENMNSYLGAKITYLFGDSTEVVDKDVISEWLTTDEDMNVTFHDDQVSSYIDTLASTYNTYQTTRTFVSGNMNTVSVSGGSYGWIIDKATEKEALLNDILAGNEVEKEPAYKQKAASHDGPDWGSTYVEVDLTNQYMYLYVSGSLITSGPVVTGKPSAGDATPQGVYSIRYKAQNATLRGPKKPDGEYEWESPVSYWMPFNGGIGLHDAPWQSAFGGSRYLTYGSHGCVNLQYGVAQTVYENVQAGTPVICHY